MWGSPKMQLTHHTHVVIVVFDAVVVAVAVIVVADVVKTAGDRSHRCWPWPCAANGNMLPAYV